jgi:hypothetical protein
MLRCNCNKLYLGQTNIRRYGTGKLTGVASSPSATAPNLAGCEHIRWHHRRCCWRMCCRVWQHRAEEEEGEFVDQQRDRGSYLRLIFAHDPHAVTQPNKVSAQVITRMCSHNTLESQHSPSHPPLSLLHLYPMRSRPQKADLTMFLLPPIRCDRYLPRRILNKDKLCQLECCVVTHQKFHL